MMPNGTNARLALMQDGDIGAIKHFKVPAFASAADPFLVRANAVPP